MDTTTINNSTPVKFWQGTNFWVAAVLAIGGLWVGFPSGDAQHSTELIVGALAGVFAIREKLKDLKIDWKQWIKSANTWNYLATVFVAILPTIPIELFQALRGIIEAALGGNWQGIVAGVFSLATILYYWLKPK